MTRTIMLAMGILLIGFAARAEPACVTPEMQRQELRRLNPAWTSRVVGDFVDETAQRLIEVWNLTPPESHVEGDRVIIFEGVSGQRVSKELVIGIYKHGCFVEGGTIERNFLHATPRGEI